MHRSSVVLEAAEALYAELRADGFEVLFDDRDARPGVKFADAELLGIPHRLVISERNLAAGELEYRHRQDPESRNLKREEALKAIDLAWSENRIIPDTVMVARTFLGDLDGAMEIARLLELPGEAFSMEMIFIPDLAPLRQHADFLPLVERLGIAGYWDELGCRWDGDRVHCLGS